MNKRANRRQQRYLDRAEAAIAEREAVIKRMRGCRFDTISVHGIYSLEEALMRNQGAIIEPAYLSTSQHYADSDEMEAALAYRIPSWCYARIATPSVYYLEWMLALLEGYGAEVETGALVTSSGMAAIVTAIDPFLVRQGRDASTPINFVSSCHIYGGAFQQFAVRHHAERGIEVRWVDTAEIDAWAARIDRNTRFLYVETPSNPTLFFADIDALADLAHSHGIPLIVDATVATPALLRPLSHGADIVVHSVSKSMTSSGMGVGGVVVSRKNLTSTIDNDEMKADFATWTKQLPFRDNGPCMNPLHALLVMNDLRTLRTKMDLFSRTGMTVAAFLEDHPNVEAVNYPGLPGSPHHALASRYMTLVDSAHDTGAPIPRFGHLMSFTVKGGAMAARRVFDKFALIFRATDLGRVKSVATIPAISTHQQQGKAARVMAGIPANLIRLNVGGEHPDDIVADLDQALRCA